MKSQFKDAQAAATADFDGLVANTAQEMKELEDEVKALKKKLKETSSAAADFEARYIKAKSAAQIAEGNFISCINLKFFAFVFIARAEGAAMAARSRKRSESPLSAESPVRRPHKRAKRQDDCSSCSSDSESEKRPTPIRHSHSHSHGHADRRRKPSHRSR